MHKKAHRLAILVITMFITVSSAFADKEAPMCTYTITSSDGKYILVMRSPNSAEKAEEIRKIRSKYSQSGLYFNDGSTNALWTIDWYAHNVELSSDGIHLVRRGPWASSIMDEALTFFAKGELLRSYRINQLVDNPWLMPRSVSHFSWKKMSSMDDQNKSYHLRTIHGESYRFDVTTGRIVSSFRTPRWLFGGFLIGIAVSVWGSKKRKKLAILTRGILKIALVVAAAWAMWLPGLFVLIVFNHPSPGVFINFIAVIACGTLAVAGFRYVPLFLWVASYAVIVGLCIVGALYHIRDSGEWGQIQWLDGYTQCAAPLLIIFALVQLFRLTQLAEIPDGEVPQLLQTPL